jgi:LysM repeat protein
MELKSVSQVLIGFLIALFSVAIVIGSFAISLAESGRRVVKSSALSATLPLNVQAVTTELKEITTGSEQPFKTLTSSPAPATDTYTPRPPTPSPSPTLTPTEEQKTIAPSQTATPTATHTKRPRSTATKAVVSCGPPSSWVHYTIKHGDTLTRIGLTYGVSITQLQSANCLGNSTAIQAGKQLYVPNVVPHPPLPTIKPAKSPKPTSKPPITKPPVIVTMPPATTEPPPPAALGYSLSPQ